MVEKRRDTTKETAIGDGKAKKRKKHKPKNHKQNHPNHHSHHQKPSKLARKRKQKEKTGTSGHENTGGVRLLTPVAHPTSEQAQQTQQALSTPLLVSVEEQSLIGKTGNLDECEDALFLGEHFIAVIDGATSKTERRWLGQTGGRYGAQIVAQAFNTLPQDATARQAVDHLTQMIRQVYEQEQVLAVVASQPVQRMIVCFAALSLFRRELWLVGDCQALLNSTHVTNEKEIDAVLANARSLFLETEVQLGKTIEELLLDDTGRAYILPLLQRQMLFQNKPNGGPYWFAVIDGFVVPDSGIKVVPLPLDTETIVLASDGYPILKESLNASEQALHTLLKSDPLLFREYKATKGMTTGNSSFDDRTYVKLRVTHDV